jgi:adenylyltransferase/sulfurtransferase
LIDYEVFCGVRPTDGVDPGLGEGPSGVSGEAAGFDEIGASEVFELLRSGEPPFLLDVREPWEWAVSNLGEHAARLIPLGELGGRLAEVPRGRPVVAYCRSGQRSRTAARRLAEAGFEPLYSMTGGLRSWAEEVDGDVRVV